MEKIKPRFEFRTFAQNFGIVERKMREHSEIENLRESAEIYIMSGANNENNTKIRDDKMDIKVLVQEKEGLEQWKPRMKGKFPMNATQITNEVFPAFGVKMIELQREEYTQKQYLDEIIKPHPGLVAVHVFKRRFAFTVNKCICEIADILINGALIKTVSIESTEINDILKTKEMLRLTEYENINYLLAIKRVIGMEALPFVPKL